MVHELPAQRELANSRSDRFSSIEAGLTDLDRKEFFEDVASGMFGEIQHILRTLPGDDDTPKQIPWNRTPLAAIKAKLNPPDVPALQWHLIPTSIGPSASEENEPSSRFVQRVLSEFVP